MGYQKTRYDIIFTNVHMFLVMCFLFFANQVL